MELKIPFNKIFLSEMRGIKITLEIFKRGGVCWWKIHHSVSAFIKKVPSFNVFINSGRHLLKKDEDKKCGKADRNWKMRLCHRAYTDVDVGCLRGSSMQAQEIPALIFVSDMR